MFRLLENTDLLEYAEAGYVDAIAHGCNCFHSMGSGIAYQIRTRYPQAYAIDVLNTRKGDRSKLGTYTLIYTGKFYIFNCYTQYDYGRDGQDRFEYKAFQRILDTLPEQRYGFPMIGCGLAGGNAEIILGMLEKSKLDITVCSL